MLAPTDDYPRMEATEADELLKRVQDNSKDSDYKCYVYVLINCFKANAMTETPSVVCSLIIFIYGVSSSM